MRALSILSKCEKIILKTDKTDCCKILKEQSLSYETLDEIYETAEDFDALNLLLAEQVIKRSHGITAYCVPYSPETDASVTCLGKFTELKLYPASGHTGVLSGAEACSYTAVSAYRLGDVDTFAYLKDAPLLVYDVDSKLVAGSVKLFLSEIVGDEAECLFFDGQIKRIKVYELDTMKRYSYKCEIAVLPTTVEKRLAFSYYDLIEILKRLRRPDGCPWDRVQTHESIKSNLIEESYELVEAIELGDAEKIEEESGDVLMQAVFHAAIATDQGEFTFRNMLDHLCGKLVFRHSHVFGEDSASGSSEALTVWEKNKRIEKNQNSLYDTLTAVPKQFPALLRLYKVLKKIHKEHAVEGALSDRSAYDKFCAEVTSDTFNALITSAVAEMAARNIEPEVALQSYTDRLIERYRPDKNVCGDE